MRKKREERALKTITIHKKGIETAKFLFHPHMRHKTIFVIAYGAHLAVEHVSPETAGAFQCIIEILHVFVG